MIRINIQGMLEEKRAKELQFSLNELINTILNTFKKQLEKSYDKKEYIFELEFDNNSSFYITSLYNGNEIIQDYGYIDRFGINKDVLELQEALNINKYALEIEKITESFISQNSIKFEGIFLMQNIDRKLPIFHERDVHSRYENIKNTEFLRYVSVYNILTRNLER